MRTSRRRPQVKGMNPRGGNEEEMDKGGRDDDRLFPKNSAKQISFVILNISLKLFQSK